MPEKDPPRVVPDSELAVLKVLWEHGDATVRAIRERVYPDGGTSEHATVQKLLDRLAGRGCVTRHREGRAHVWSATVERQELIGDRLRQAAEKLCDGSLTPLLTHLVDAQRLSPEEIRALRDLVDQLEEQTP